jgi:hypothetical protein
MKITKRQLRSLIKEEKSKLLKEDHRPEVWQLYYRLQDIGVNDGNILEYILGNWMPSHDAQRALADYLADELGEEL